MSDLYAALDTLTMPTIFWCETLPWLDRDLDYRLKTYYTPDGEKLDGDLISAMVDTTKYQLLPENSSHTSLTYQGADIEVATDYIGQSAAILGHQWPVIFETMIFADIPGLNNWCRRYITRAAAMYGHKIIVAMLVINGASLVAETPS